MSVSKRISSDLFSYSKTIYHELLKKDIHFPTTTVTAVILKFLLTLKVHCGSFWLLHGVQHGFISIQSPDLSTVSGAQQALGHHLCSKDLSWEVTI